MDRSYVYVALAIALAGAAAIALAPSSPLAALTEARPDHTVQVSPADVGPSVTGRSDGSGGSEPMGLQGDLVAAFYYQGFLTEDDEPVSGTRSMEFQLWSTDKQSEQVGVTLDRTVQVQDGQFNVSLGWGPNEFNGRGLRLQVRVQDSAGAWHALGRQNILAVPYAMSLYPGAQVVRQSGPHVLRLENKGGPGLVSSGDEDGVVGQTTSADSADAGVKGQAFNTSGQARGGSFSSATGVGVYGSSLANHGVQGKGSSATGYYGGHFTGDSGVYAEATGRGRDSHAGFFDGEVSMTQGLEVDGPVVLNDDIWALTIKSRARIGTAKITGTLTTGALVVQDVSYGPMFRPEWDSRWQGVGRGATETFTHNVGGDPSDYFADFQCRDTSSSGMGIHVFGHGGLSVTNPPAPMDSRGAYYRNLTSSSVRVYRLPDDDYCDQVRVRIWVIN